MRRSLLRSSSRRGALVVAAMPVLVAACGTDGEIDLLARAPDGATDSASDAAADGTSDGAGAGDAAGADCTSGACPCGLTLCGAACVDLLNDPAHCGACAGTLLHFQYCRAGVPTCLPGFTMCDGACRDFRSDPDHCGGCATAPCASGEKCENGVCSSGACSAGLTGCPVASSRLACADLTRGAPYCGDCTTVCGPDQVCAGAACEPYAPATPCATCPCANDCARTEGTPAACCPGIGGNAQPICVHGGACP